MTGKPVIYRVAVEKAIAFLAAWGRRKRAKTTDLCSAVGEYAIATRHLIALNATTAPPLPDSIRLHDAAEWLLEE